MTKHHHVAYLDCDTNHAARLGKAILERQGWAVVENGRGGMIARIMTPTPDGASPAECAFEITWRTEGHETRLSIYGPVSCRCPSLSATCRAKLEAFFTELEKLIDVDS